MLLALTVIAAAGFMRIGSYNQSAAEFRKKCSEFEKQTFLACDYCSCRYHFMESANG